MTTTCKLEEAQGTAPRIRVRPIIILNQKPSAYMRSFMAQCHKDKQARPGQRILRGLRKHLRRPRKKKIKEEEINE